MGDKEIAKKPLKSGVTDSAGVFHEIVGIEGVPYDLCPVCGSNLSGVWPFSGIKPNYCPNCGQKLDWGR